MPKLEKALSGFSGDNVENRYQKALKEITKLIVLNNQFKEQARNAQEEREKLKIENQKLQSSMDEVTKQKNDLDEQLDELTLRYQELEEECLKLDKPIRTSNSKSDKKQPLDMKHFKDLDSKNTGGDSGLQLRKKMQEIIKINSDQEKYIKQLEKVKDNKDKLINSLTKQCDELSNKVKQLSTHLQDFQKYQEIKTENKGVNQETLHSMSKEDLMKKVKISHGYIKNTNNECVQLRAKVIQLERDNKIMRTKSERTMVRYSSPVPSNCSSKPRLHNRFDDYMIRNPQEAHFTELLKRGNKIEAQNKNISKKYQILKNRFDSYKNETKNDLRQLEILKKKCQGYEKIIEKLEKQIERLLNQYEHDMITKTEQFKQKLDEQRNTFGPTQFHKHLKQLEKLHAENKAIKKRNQMFRTEITKNGKTLEMFKAKINELQYKLNITKEQNHRLNQKMKMMKSVEPQKAENLQKMVHHQHLDSLGYESEDQSPKNIRKSAVNQLLPGKKRKGSPI